MGFYPQLTSSTAIEIFQTNLMNYAKVMKPKKNLILMVKTGDNLSLIKSWMIMMISSH